MVCTYFWYEMEIAPSLYECQASKQALFTYFLASMHKGHEHGLGLLKRHMVLEARGKLEYTREALTFETLRPRMSAAKSLIMNNS